MQLYIQVGPINVECPKRSACDLRVQGLPLDLHWTPYLHGSDGGRRPTPVKVSASRPTVQGQRSSGVHITLSPRELHVTVGCGLYNFNLHQPGLCMISSKRKLRSLLIATPNRPRLDDKADTIPQLDRYQQDGPTVASQNLQLATNWHQGACAGTPTRLHRWTSHLYMLQTFSPDSDMPPTASMRNFVAGAWQTPQHSTRHDSFGCPQFGMLLPIPLRGTWYSAGAQGRQHLFALQ